MENLLQTDLPLHMTGLDPTIAQLLVNKSKHSSREVLQLSVLELTELIDLPEDDASAVLAQLSSTVLPKLYTVS